MRKCLFLTAVLVLGSLAAQAGTIVLTFEGLQNNEQVLNYYNGGFGGSGSGPGPNYGITFGTDSLALISAAFGGTGNFSGSPSMPTILYFLSGPGDVMNVAAGFTTGFSFFYSAINSPGVVTVWSGPNATGTMLASLNLPTTPSTPGVGPCLPTLQFCPWFPIGVAFSGTAMSVNFSGTANQIGFDDVTLGSSTPGTPEPGTLVMFGSGALGLATVLRRKFFA